MSFTKLVSSTSVQALVFGVAVAGALQLVSQPEPAPLRVVQLEPVVIVGHKADKAMDGTRIARSHAGAAEVVSE